MPCAFQFFLSEKFDFCTHVLYRIFEGVLCDMRINIQSRTDLGVSHTKVFGGTSLDALVCLCLLLAQDLAAHILNTASAFHSCFRSLLKNYHDTAISLS